MTDDLTTRLLAAIEEVELAIGNLSPNLLLAHCAAHRKIVELHGREVEPHWNRGQRHDYAVCSGCFTGVGTGERVAFPCDTLVALAEAYGLTTEPAP